jgi:ADP-ribose pyrophosphatase YjhB (NUDIX family)
VHTPHLVIDETWYRRLPAAKERVAAGGVVLRREDQCVYLALAREGDLPPFVLPKGGVEPDEPIEAAARREILEEVGLSDLQLIGPLGVLERLSYDKQYWVQTHYFLYTTNQKDGIPTDTQRHAAVWWFPLDELPVMLWPEQRRLLDTHRATFETVCAARQRDIPTTSPDKDRGFA